MFYLGIVYLQVKEITSNKEEVNRQHFNRSQQF